MHLCTLCQHCGRGTDHPEQEYVEGVISHLKTKKIVCYFQNKKYSPCQMQDQGITITSTFILCLMKDHSIINLEDDNVKEFMMGVSTLGGRTFSSIFKNLKKAKQYCNSPNI
ncbi:MAG: hypothetical protein ACE5KT_02670 [Methanosarcinales archaeon]